MTLTSRLQLALSTLQLRLFCVRPFSHLSSDSTLIHSKIKRKKKISIIYKLKNTTKCLFTEKIKKLLLNFRGQKKIIKNKKTAGWFPKLSENKESLGEPKKKVKINNPNLQKKLK